MAKLVDAGIDYIRVTTTDAREQNKCSDYYLAIAKADKALGHKERAAGAFGFIGRATRHALMAYKKEWAMLQVSGSAAQESIMLVSERSQATRIDIQATILEGEEEVRGKMLSLYEEACDWKGYKGRPAKVTGVFNRHDVQTIYIGSRSSDWFIRIYDKFAESGKEEHRGCIRYEVEIKGRASKALWRLMAEKGKGVTYLLKVLETHLKRNGIEMPKTWLPSTCPQMPIIERTTIESTMAWLRRAVAPAYTRCAIELGWFAPLLEIVSNVLYDEEQYTLTSVMAQIWGS